VNVLVDTSVVSELKRGRHAHPRVVAWFSNVPSERVFTSVIVLGEVRRGIELVARRDKRQAELLQRWYASIREHLANRVLAVDEPIIMIWSKISVPHLHGTRSWHDCRHPQCVGLPARRSGRYRSVVPVNRIGFFSARSFHAKAGSDYIVRERPAHGIEIHSGRIVNAVSIVYSREFLVLA
jgi:predicted nucleic acid-binding protein